MSITKISPSVVDFDDGITITVDDNSDALTLTSTDADASIGPVLNLYRNSSSPADVDLVGSVKYVARNDNSQDVTTFTIQNYITDVSDGTEDAASFFYLMEGGALHERIGLGTAALVINEEGLDYDFRVEGDSNTHALFVQASDNKVGIGVSDPGGLPLHLKVASGDNKLRMETAAKDAFTLALDNSTGDTIIGTHTLYPAVRFLNAGGIAFGSDTAAANALDDYEEGTWSVDLTGCDDNLSSPTGHYTKIGRLVYVYWYSGGFTISNASGVAFIGGLPFTVRSNSGQAYSTFQYLHGDAVDGNTTGGYFDHAATTMRFIDAGSTGGSTYVNGSRYIMISGVYETDS